VKLIADGRYRNRGPMGRGVLVDMGPTVVLDTGKVEKSSSSPGMSSRTISAASLSLGIDPLTKRYLHAESRIPLRAGFKPIAKAIIECAGTGVCTSDYGQLSVPQCPSADASRSISSTTRRRARKSFPPLPRREETRDRDRPP